MALKYFFCLPILAISAIALGQTNKLKAFEPLMGSTWAAEGTWGDGSKFKQESILEYGLDSTLVLVHSKGFTNQEQTEYGRRNLGVRKFDSETNSIKFWEYDVFGGITEGTVSLDGKNIRYEYNYGGTTVTDLWEYVDANTYNFKVGNHTDGEWKQVYLETQFHRKDTIMSNLQKNLIGHWQSDAWDGILSEAWKNEDGALIQQSQYLVNGDVQYEAVSKIETIDGELILFSVIKDSNPKIFKATSIAENEIVFENTEYKNPNKVVYAFKSDGTYERTISGTENENPTTYTFKFEHEK